MGGKCPHRRVKKRSYSPTRTKHRLGPISFSRSDDAVYEGLQELEGESKPLRVDEDLPGMGQYYCLHCEDEHFRTKRHKKRLKLIMGPAPHTQLDADLAAGMGVPDNGPKFMSI